MSAPVSIKEVAAHAGVSVGTVSNLLNRPENVAGGAVPDEMALAGYDDIEFAAAAAVPLSSVRQSRQELGRMAAHLLLGETSGGRHKHRQVVFQPELEIRRSSQARLHGAAAGAAG